MTSNDHDAANLVVNPDTGRGDVTGGHEKLRNGGKVYIQHPKLDVNHSEGILKTRKPLMWISNNYFLSKSRRIT